MTAVPPRPAAPKCNCGPGHETVCHQFGTEPHFVGCPRWGEPVVASDATAGDGLRSAIVRRLTRWDIRNYDGIVFEGDAEQMADAVLALPALRDVLAAAARDAEKVRQLSRVIGLTADWLIHLETLAAGRSPLAQEVRRQAAALRRARDAP